MWCTYIITCLKSCYLCECWALHVFHSLEVSCQLLSCLRSDGLLLVLGQLLNGGRVIPQVNLSPNQQEWGLWTVVGDLWNPLFTRRLQTAVQPWCQVLEQHRMQQFKQKSPFLWHFQRKRGRQQKNRPGTRLSVDNSTAVTCRNLPDLKKTQIELAKWNTVGKWYVRAGGKAYLLYQTDPECKALLRSSQLRRSYQTPETDTHSVISAEMISAAMTPSSPTCLQTHRRDIFRGKFVCGVRDEQAGFTHSTVTNDNTLDGLHGCVSLFPAHPISATEVRHKRPSVTGCGIAKTVQWSAMITCAIYTCCTVTEPRFGPFKILVGTPAHQIPQI